jgi:hypothetical protein
MTPDGVGAEKPSTSRDQAIFVDQAWRSPRSPGSAGPRSAATPAEVQAILAEVTRIRPELTAFFGRLYYAALRPAEAVARCVPAPAPCPQVAGDSWQSQHPSPGQRGPGLATAPHANSEASSTARTGATRTVPIPPQLACLLRWHLQTFGCADDGRLFRGARGGPLSEGLYGRIWHQARAAAMPEDETGTQPARRPYDLRPRSPRSAGQVLRLRRVCGNSGARLPAATREVVPD